MVTLPTITTCSIPAGIYPIGDAQIAAARPAHSVTVSAFALAETPLTNGQFAPFIDAGGYQDESLWTDKGQRWLASKSPTEPGFWQATRHNHPLQPVVGVGWYESLAFATWLARETGQPWRLPTEIEWEAAARGTDTPPALPDPKTINSAESALGRAWAALGTGQVSWCGARDLCGNVWEWTASRWGRNWQSLDYAYPYDPDDGREDLTDSHARVMRGGSFFDRLSEAHPANRGRFLPGSRASNIGFRLALG